MFRNYINVLPVNAKLTTFHDFIRDDLATANRGAINVQVKDVLSFNRNIDRLEKLLDQV